MANLLISVMLMVFVAAVVDANGCCTPDQWEGMLGSSYLTCKIAKTEDGQDGVVQEFILYSYDYTNKKLAANLTDATGTKNWILDYSKHMFYMIRGTKCVKGPLKPDMQQFCTPANATAMGEMTFGTGQDSMTGVNYMSTVGGLITYTTVTKNNCIPFGQLTTGTWGQENALASAGYFNVTLGIKDPSVFTPPSFCSPREAHEGKPGSDNDFDRVMKLLYGGY